MKKKLSITLLTVSVLICCMLTACNTGKATIYYSEIEENGEIVAYSVSGSSDRKYIIIPSTYNDKPITAIGEYAFNEGAFLFVHLQNITIPDSVTEIGVRAFDGCHKLTDIYFDGTKEQWETIDKGDDWDSGMGAFNGIGWYMINCTDGVMRVRIERE